jgi:hypothetical protein
VLHSTAATAVLPALVALGALPLHPRQLPLAGSVAPATSAASRLLGGPPFSTVPKAPAISATFAALAILPASVALGASPLHPRQLLLAESVAPVALAAFGLLWGSPFVDKYQRKLLRTAEAVELLMQPVLPMELPIWLPSA